MNKDSGFLESHWSVHAKDLEASRLLGLKTDYFMFVLRNYQFQIHYYQKDTFLLDDTLLCSTTRILAWQRIYIKKLNVSPRSNILLNPKS